MLARTPFTLLALTALALPAAAQFDPPEAIDINPDPDIVEVNLTAAVTTWQFIPGVDTTVYAYNGSVPGPTIRTKKGDTLIVNFQNDLPEATTVHWHGIESYADQDGAHIAQRPVMPGESFTYNFETNDDALFWYHPHVRPFDQVEKGLYGGLLVKDPALEASLGLLNVDEHIILFDDILLDANDEIVPAFSFTDPLQNVLYQVNGRAGNHLLVNGRLAGTQSLNARNGQPVRFRIANCANTTITRLDFNDALTGIGQDLWQVGQDAGFLGKPFKKLAVTSTAPGSGGDHPDQVLLAEMGQGVLLFPGERDDVVITPTGTTGQSYTVTQNDWFRGRHAAVYNSMGMIMLPDDPLDGFYPTVPYFDMTLVGTDPGTGPYVPPATLRTLPVRPDPIGVLPVMYGHSMPDMNGDVTFFVQAQMQMINMVMTMVPLPAMMIDSFNAHDVNVGETWDWEVTNMSHGDHNFHTHGFFFELIEYRWEDDLNPTDPTLNFFFNPFQRRIKDTIRIPARLGAKGTSRSVTTLRATFSDANRVGRTAASGMLPTFDTAGNWTSGGWLFHCHILEHSGRGMLSVFEVHENGEVFRNFGKHKGGTAGVYPSLHATGDLSPGSTVSITAIDMLPGKKCWLVVGDTDGMRPIAGGTLVPTASPVVANLPLFKPMGTFADVNGEATWDLTTWDAMPSGTVFWAQVAARDQGAQGKLTLSNAIKFTKP